MIFYLHYYMQDNCAPCEARKPAAEIIAEESGLPLAYVDVKNPRNVELLEAHGVRSTPTLVLANYDGRLAGWVGNLIKPDAVLKVIERFRRDA